MLFSPSALGGIAGLAVLPRLGIPVVGHKPARTDAKPNRFHTVLDVNPAKLLCQPNAPTATDRSNSG